MPPASLSREHEDGGDHAGILWRVHRTVGEYVLAWNELRRFGPLPSMRWEPHAGPKLTHSDEGVLYASGDVATALAEVYQTTRLIDTRMGAPRLTAWEPIRPLRLLDLSGTWLIRNGASAALLRAPRSICRRWARAIRTTWPELDGLAVPSTMTGAANVVLWTPAADAMPQSPVFSRDLAHPLVWSLAAESAEQIGYRIR